MDVGKRTRDSKALPSPYKLKVPPVPIRYDRKVGIPLQPQKAKK
jgi:hypothetical protein